VARSIATNDGDDVHSVESHGEIRVETTRVDAGPSEREWDSRARFEGDSSVERRGETTTNAATRRDTTVFDHASEEVFTRVVGGGDRRTK